MSLSPLQEVQSSFKNKLIHSENPPSNVGGYSSERENVSSSRSERMRDRESFPTDVYIPNQGPMPVSVAPHDDKELAEKFFVSIFYLGCLRMSLSPPVEV